ncbi:MAG: acyl-CoA synthetase [Pseudomonadota bacterium]
MPFSLASVQDAVAAAVPDRPALIFRDRRFTYAQLVERTYRFANVLLAHGVDTPTPRAQLRNWESGQDQIALYLQNGNEYIEAQFGAIKAGAAPFNVNYRYVEEELRYLFDDAKAQAVVYHAQFAPLLAKVLAGRAAMKVLLQVEDGSGEPLLPGALDYEAALAAASPQRPDAEWSADDLYILYTGGTTGMPKGVLWRQGDILAAALGGRRSGGALLESLDEYADRARVISPNVYLPTPPFMHGTAQWIAYSAWNSGHTIVMQDVVDRFDPDDILSVIERERVNMLCLVGDAFGRPFLSALEDSGADVSSLTHILNGGAAMHPATKTALFDKLPSVRIIDTIGSSETGPQARQVAKDVSDTREAPRAVGGNCVLSADRTRVEAPGHKELGWFAKSGHVPLGYLGDEEKTKASFPVVDGVRYAAPGDRVRLREDGSIEFHGRDSQSINSGGEKVFVEEVERAVGAHPDVVDTLVSWRPSERWGQEVVAMVQLAPGAAPDNAAILAAAASHIARYKLPKAIVFVDKIGRQANGKPDYRWAKTMADAYADGDN